MPGCTRIRSALRDIGPEVRSALTPLARKLANLPPADRAAWLHELRETSPVFVEVMERMLAGEDVGRTTIDASVETWARLWKGLIRRRRRPARDDSPEEAGG